MGVLDVDSEIEKVGGDLVAIIDQDTPSREELKDELFAYAENLVYRHC